MKDKKALDFIDIISPCGRTSSFSVYGKMDNGNLRVVGNLEHNYQFKPKTRHDRDKLIDWLRELKYEKED